MPSWYAELNPMQRRSLERESSMNKQPKDIHEDIASLLPWLVNDSLSGKERERLLGHLIVCQKCRETRDELQSLMALISEDDAASESYQPAFRALQKRIDAAEREKQVLADFDFQAGNRFAQLNQGMSWLSARMHYVAATVVLMVGVIVLSPEWTDTGNPGAPVAGSPEAASTYKTLTSEIPQEEGSYHRAVITFAPDAESEVIREILIKTNARIVRNSDTEDSFVVDLEIPSSVSKVDFIARIRKMDAVISVVLATN